jgi:hypothetical protein
MNVALALIAGAGIALVVAAVLWVAVRILTLD